MSIYSSCTGLKDLTYVTHTVHSSGEFSLNVKNPGMHLLNITTVKIVMGERSWEWDVHMFIPPSSEVSIKNEDLDHGLETGTAYRFKIVIEFIQSELEHSESASCMGQVQGTRWS